MSRNRPYESTKEPNELFKQYELRYLETYYPGLYAEYIKTKRAKSDVVWNSPLITPVANFAKKDLERKVIGNQVKSEGNAKCSKCRSTNVTFEMVQARSADEPQSVKYRCQSCRHEWNIR